MNTKGETYLTDILRDPECSLRYFLARLESSIPTCFVRLSDGELQVLLNRKLELSTNGDGIFRGARNLVRYSEEDQKFFSPERHKTLADELRKSTQFQSAGYFLGIPCSKNKMDDEEFKFVESLKENQSNLTFCDLFSNVKLRHVERTIDKILRNQKCIIVANFRAERVLRKKGLESNFYIPDNAFGNCSEIIDSWRDFIVDIPSGSVVFSSASSLSNILGYHLWMDREDVSFYDLGTVLNPFLGFSLTVRDFQSASLYRDNRLSTKLRYFKFKIQRYSKLKW